MHPVWEELFPQLSPQEAQSEDALVALGETETELSVALPVIWMEEGLILLLLPTTRGQECVSLLFVSVFV